MSVGIWLAIAGLGGVGAVTRFVLDGAVAQRFGRAFPVGTLAINLSGAFVLGLLSGLGVAGDSLLLEGTAAIGSYTTFSTWMLETQRLAEDGDPRAAGLNVAVSLVAGVSAAAAGRLIGEHL